MLLIEQNMLFPQIKPNQMMKHQCKRGVWLSKNSTHPVSECNPEEGTQLPHPEQCQEERHHHS